MVSPRAVRRELRCHPRSSCPAVRSVAVEIEIAPDAQGPMVRVELGIEAALARLRIPVAPQLLDPERLWAHTCVELFVAAAEGEAYVEHNFSPTGQVAGFSFASYRQRRPVPPPTGAVTVDASPGMLRMRARAPLPADLGPRLHLSPTVVIEDAAGGLSYWAVRHPRERPDFHDRAGFSLALTLTPSPTLVDLPVTSP